MRSTILILVLFPILILAHTEPIIQYDNVFILSGQSNMVGMGGVKKQSIPWDRRVPVECAADSFRIFRMGSNLTWEVATEPLHQGIGLSNQNCGVGPGMPFANKIKNRVAGSIILVPCAVGATPIDQWQREKPPYDSMIHRARVASESGQIKAMLWYQGEQDSSSLQNVDNYNHLMVDLFTNIRTDLNLPGLPIIQVAIVSGGPFAKVIRNLQKGLIMPNGTCVDAKGLEIYSNDHTHLTTTAQVKLRRMLADKYISKFLT